MVICATCEHRAHEGVCVTCMGEYERDERSYDDVCATPMSPPWVDTLVNESDQGFA